MKKAVNILTIIYIILLFWLTKNKDILALTISSSIYLLFSSIFSTLEIKEKDIKKINYIIIAIMVIFIPLTIISYFIGNILDIYNLGIINIIMSITCCLNIIIKLLRQYFEVVQNKKAKSILNIHKIITIILNILVVIITFGIFNIKNNIGIIILYLTNIVSSVGIILLVRRLTPKNKINIKLNNIIDIKNNLISNKTITIYNIINCSYIYVSIIIMYYILTNKYNYSYENISIYISNTYFYGIFFIYSIIKIIKKILNINIKDNFIKNLNKVIKIALPITILLTIISKSISNIAFSSKYNIVAGLIPLIFIYLLYDFIITTSIEYNNNKKNIITLIIGIIIKMIFELPLINTVDRMGYDYYYGSILSIILGLLVSCIISIIFIRNKLKLNLLNNFNNLLNIIYENIIYTLVLVLFTFIIKINTNNVIESLLVIMFYSIITLIFYIIKKKIQNKG